MLSAAVILVFAGLAAGYGLRDTPPVFSKQFTLGGTLRLPYAEIDEPFMVWFDGVNNRSRIDYYGSLVITIQRADQGQFGISYKLASMTNYQVKNQLTCFQMNGSSDMPVAIQNILPDLTDFKKVNPEVINGQQCDTWQLVQMVGTKKNTYTMWVTSSDQTPVRYELMGFDSLLGSHYDKYVLDYSNYSAASLIPEVVFQVPPTLKCGGFPGPGREHYITMNPMQEYVHHRDDHTHIMFQQFKIRHQKSYDTEEEHQQRLHIFRQNLRYIHSKNRAGLSYTLGVNHLADRTDMEIRKLRGYRFSKGSHGGLPFDMSKYNLKDVPESKDWRLYGAVTPVKDQGVCGSCWSFGTTGTIEGTYFLKTGMLVRLSQQQLMDCSWGEGNNACDGGEEFRSYRYIMKTGGLSTEEEYGQYLAQDGRCHSDQVSRLVKLTGYVNVTSGDLNALKTAIAMQGPVSVGIDASHKSFSFYANGVYYEPKCGNTPDDLDHAVLAVGYGVMNNQSYWLIKNSWSTHWGNDGYVLMSQKDNNCGVATDATYVQM